MIEMKIVAENAAQLKEDLIVLGALFADGAAVPVATRAETIEVNTAAVAALTGEATASDNAAPAAEEKPRRTRRPKEEKAAAEQPDAGEIGAAAAADAEPAAEAAAPAATVTYTADDIRKALGEYNKKNGMESARSLVMTFQRDDGQPCERISEVRECDFAAFIEKAKV